MLRKVMQLRYESSGVRFKIILFNSKEAFQIWLVQPSIFGIASNSKREEALSTEVYLNVPQKEISVHRGVILYLILFCNFLIKGYCERLHICSLSSGTQSTICSYLFYNSYFLFLVEKMSCYQYYISILDIPLLDIHQ